ncbi:unnamed protein product [Rotaria sordida]|uniref:Uncharacterized protein n=1 Tax=Rotaria sordida TaxID=392033 RepID=A0A814N891_9BILA|nr:unnamed protein product [Rotaria sordida]CAF1280717.1 unnamed protein product [Rotaria sordida]
MKSFIYTTIDFNLNYLISVSDTIYYCLTIFISQPNYLLPILSHYLTTNLLLLFIIHSIYNRKILFQPLNQYKLLDLLVKNLILYSNYLTNQTQILSIQRIYDQRQSLNNRMNIGSINLSSQYFSKPIDHHTIDLQQISVYSYYAYDQQMIIEQTIIDYINNNNYTFIEYFKQLKICSLSVEFLNEILINEYFLKSIEELNQQIQYIINKTSNYLLIYHGFYYLRKIIKYSNENKLITHKSIVENKDYPILLDRFVHANDVIHIVTQIDLISTSLPIPTTINNQTIIYDNDYQYYQDDIQQIESTTIQQLNTINNNNNNTNSNFWAKGTDSTHSQWKPDEIIQIQKFHEEHFIYLFDRFYSIFSNKLSEELLYDNLI